VIRISGNGPLKRHDGHMKEQSIIAVIDGQGGGIGAAIIKALRERLGEEMEIWALGTNSIATSRMMKAGANRGATGENAIVQSCPRAHVLVGPLAILMPQAMMGEVTPRMAESVCSSGAKKIIIPLTQEKVFLLGVRSEPLPHLVEEAINIIEEMTGHV
jgi:hypothetical protein